MTAAYDRILAAAQATDPSVLDAALAVGIIAAIACALLAVIHGLFGN